MATRTKTISIQKKPTNSVVTKPVACPTCGGTECFERPRYFSGQLLTDRDLDAAQRYVIDKNKLHNRYLVGTGVACGLAVRCDRCDSGSVVVQPGYAIDCCGNDIVLCDAATFDVAEYLNNCQDEDDECGKIKSKSPCDDLPKEYYLVVYYNEEPSRPVTALMRNDGCSTVRCEPSRTRETFRFAAIEKEEYRRRTEPDMWKKMTNCVRDVFANALKYWQQLEDLGKNQAPYTPTLQLFCRMRDYILAIYRNGANTRCSLALELKEIEDSLPTGPNDPDYNQKFGRAFIMLFGYLFQYVLDCICDALLVPCAPCDGDDGVVLACMTVKNCRVVKICNTVRTQLVTGPAMRYWFQPLYRGFAKLLEKLCCEIDLVALFGGLMKPRDPKEPNPTQPGTASGANIPRATVNEGTAFHNTIEVEKEPGMQYDGSMFDNLNMGATAKRGGNVIDMLGDYASAGLGAFDGASLLPLFSADTLSALDLYKLPTSEAVQLLDERKITYTTRQARSDAEAYSLGNIGKMSWAIPAGSNVELLLDSKGAISSVRMAGGTRPVKEMK